MHLEGLTGRGPQGSVPQAIRQLIHGQIEARGDASGRAAQAQHHLPVLLLSLLAVFAVVLLIAAVELQQLDGTFAEMAEIVLELGSERILEIVAVGLELLKLGALCSSGDRRGKRPFLRAVLLYGLPYGHAHAPGSASASNVAKRRSGLGLGPFQ